jgi:hypothetical protein
MEALTLLLGRIKRLNVSDLFKQVIAEDKTLQAQIIDWNIEQLYEKGKDSKGQSLGEYSAITINFYKPLAASEGRDGRTDHITLKDTGAFYRSFRILIPSSGDFIEIEADPIKDGGVNLFEAYGIDILGLDESNMDNLADEIRDRLAELIIERIAA